MRGRLLVRSRCARTVSDWASMCDGPKIPVREGLLPTSDWAARVYARRPWVSCPDDRRQHADDVRGGVLRNPRRQKAMPTRYAKPPLRRIMQHAITAFTAPVPENVCPTKGMQEPLACEDINAEPDADGTPSANPEIPGPVRCRCQPRFYGYPTGFGGARNLRDEHEGPLRVAMLTDNQTVRHLSCAQCPDGEHTVAQHTDRTHVCIPHTLAHPPSHYCLLSRPTPRNLLRQVSRPGKTQSIVPSPQPPRHTHVLCHGGPPDAYVRQEPARRFASQ